jgi:hypothetical protein
MNNPPKSDLSHRDAWADAARRELLGLCGPDGAWGYRRGSHASPEATALAGLALIATSEGSDESDESRDAARAAADHLVAAQRPDGSLGAPGRADTPGWMTPYALLLWSALGVHADARRGAVAWLMESRGATLDRRDDPRQIAGHDTTLVGWPWVDHTHSWLEPTAMAILSLAREGLGDHPRVIEGLRLIRDRSVAGGGWNYGNKAVFGRALRPQPAPTGLALLALACVDGRTWQVRRAVAYLDRCLPETRAAASIGWAIVGLRAWGEVPEESGRWLSESYGLVRGRPDAAPRLALLLLAASGGTLGLFGRATR